ncbi:MAG: ribosomal L7Ae/L30e/S12e/Gadd45 family protein [Oscillospiraceae bacterium]|nr:hypothetical protein [Ruminococcus sp.]MBQ7013370.1 ribosomal L7Ae/L30e/S12e/Gadd45 family protein [Oscillospiraceae bacterium]
MLYQKLTGLLSICRKAGRMEIGFAPMLEALKAGKICGVIVTEDVSPKTHKEVCYHCERAGIPVCPVPLSQMQLGAAIGRKAAVVGLTDDGFFDRIRTLCETQCAGD